MSENLHKFDIETLLLALQLSICVTFDFCALNRSFFELKCLKMIKNRQIEPLKEFFFKCFYFFFIYI
ncbi:hypothetical protein ATS72_002195 [Pseudoalteromonas sp. 13-15]|nr:hypothetical protein ATS72_002195 [Pseudoalteromonas sp. 13-15]